MGKGPEQKKALTPEQRRQRARIAAHTMWSKVPDRAKRTEAGRRSFEDRFEREVDPEGAMSPEDRAKAAESARKAYFSRLAYRSAQARKKYAQERKERIQEQETVRPGGAA